MGTGDEVPLVSCTLGPSGASGATGAAPRAAGTAAHSSARLSSNQLQPSERTPLTRTPFTTSALPVARSASHSSMRSFCTAVNANSAPLGEKPIVPRLIAPGTVNVAPWPPARRLTVKPVMPRVRCGPFVAGFTRMPASRNIGCASSVMGGMLLRSTRTMRSPFGLVSACGIGGASRMRTMSAGGTL